jgi:hypothetical protein
MSRRRTSLIEPISELNKIKIRDNGEPLVELNGLDPRIVILPQLAHRRAPTALRSQNCH